ncbi:MAG: hypothetical protein BWY72_01543 [Bacteroidetes bacterium ADurb.Bin416]|nr:MAG: hypothetical protein BWY72_01543 [Bacteroidetes bacterium ADurb.Bin416]
MPFLVQSPYAYAVFTQYLQNGLSTLFVERPVFNGLDVCSVLLVDIAVNPGIKPEILAVIGHGCKEISFRHPVLFQYLLIGQVFELIGIKLAGQGRRNRAIGTISQCVDQVDVKQQRTHVLGTKHSFGPTSNKTDDHQHQGHMEQEGTHGRYDSAGVSLALGLSSNRSERSLR